MNRFFSRGATAGMVLAVVTFFFSCAPVNRYTVDMGYRPPEGSAPATVGAGSIPITIAGFTDARDTDEAMRIGTVVSPDGKTIPVLPKHLSPVDAVTDGIRKCLSAEGHSLSPETPAWDLRGDSIDKLWGAALLIGGSIDRLEVVCHKNNLKKTYRTEVKLTVVFADIKGARILRTMEAAATSSLVDIRFSEEILERQISEALSKAIRQVCGDGKTIRQVLEQMTKGRG